nr:MAG TPA: hypothetical protein [Bacteriophage sp.]
MSVILSFCCCSEVSNSKLFSSNCLFFSCSSSIWIWVWKPVFYSFSQKFTLCK